MSALLPKINVKRGDHPGNQVIVQLPDLSGYNKTFLSADEAAGQTALSVQSSANFAANEYVVIGELGQEGTEIRLISSVATGSITVSAASTFAHPRGTRVIFIPFNQVEISSDDNTSFSSPTTLTTSTIRVDALVTLYEDTTGAATDYYRARFYHEQGTRYSSYSDYVIATGYGDNTVHSVIRRALSSMGEKIGGKITQEFLVESLWEARREVDQDPRIFRWSFRTKFNTDIGDIIPGAWSVAAPTDLRDRNTFKNILAIRIGRNNRVVDYQDRVRFNQNYTSIGHTTIASAITTGSTSIVLTSSGDFDESGNIVIAGSAITETLDTVAYTANTESTATLSGVTGIAANKAAGIDVWQGANFGEPTGYTIDEAVVYFDMPFEDDLAGENIYMDYYQALQEANSDADELDEPVYDFYVAYLRWKIKYLKANGKIDKKKDSDYMEYVEGKERLITQEISGQDLQMFPG